HCRHPQADSKQRRRDCSGLFAVARYSYPCERQFAAGRCRQEYREPAMMRRFWSLQHRNLPIDRTTTLARAGGKRVLINEILSLQILITAVIGVLAIAGLYFGGQWVLQENYSRWALQWTEELHELGAP